MLIKINCNKSNSRRALMIFLPFVVEYMYVFFFYIHIFNLVKPSTVIEMLKKSTYSGLIMSIKKKFCLRCKDRHSPFKTSLTANNEFKFPYGDYETLIRFTIEKSRKKKSAFFPVHYYFIWSSRYLAMVFVIWWFLHSLEAGSGEF